MNLDDDSMERLIGCALSMDIQLERTADCLERVADSLESFLEMFDELTYAERATLMTVEGPQSIVRRYFH